MAFELREGQGTLFANKDRTKDTQPNARGEMMLNGVLYEISAWTKEGKNGKFQSLSVKPKQARQERSAEPRRQSYGEATGRDRSHDDDSLDF